MISLVTWFVLTNQTYAWLSRWRAFAGNFELTSVLRCVYLLVNKVAVLVSRVKSTNALHAHQREWLLTNLPDS